MPDPLAVHFTTSPPDARHHIAGPCDVTAAIMLACAPELGLVAAGDWKHTGDPSDVTCDGCHLSPVWLEAARAVITDLAGTDQLHMRPLAGRHRRVGEVVIGARGRSQLEERRIRTLEELAVAAWSLAVSRPPSPPSFPATPGGDGTADRVLEDLRLRQFVADEVAAILKRRPDLAARYPTDTQIDDLRRAARRELAPAAALDDAYRMPAPVRPAVCPGDDIAADPYGWPADDPALD